MTDFEGWAFLYNAEREFTWLCEKLGDPDPQMRAFLLTRELSARTKELHDLVKSIAEFDRLSHAAAQLSGTDRDAPGKPTGKQPPHENY